MAYARGIAGIKPTIQLLDLCFLFLYERLYNSMHQFLRILNYNLRVGGAAGEPTLQTKTVFLLVSYWDLPVDI